MRRHDRNDPIAAPLRSLGAPLRATLAWVLTFLFAGRVLAQAIQRWWPQPFLPPFGRFQGSGLAYPVLVSAQLLILMLMMWVAARITTASWSPGPTRVRVLSIFGLPVHGSVRAKNLDWMAGTGGAGLVQGVDSRFLSHGTGWICDDDGPVSPAASATLE
jgi:hypothetical protein